MQQYIFCVCQDARTLQVDSAAKSCQKYTVQPGLHQGKGGKSEQRMISPFIVSLLSKLKLNLLSAVS